MTVRIRAREAPKETKMRMMNSLLFIISIFWYAPNVNVKHSLIIHRSTQHSIETITANTTTWIRDKITTENITSLALNSIILYTTLQIKVFKIIISTIEFIIFRNPLVVWINRWLCECYVHKLELYEIWFLVRECCFVKTIVFNAEKK